MTNEYRFFHGIKYQVDLRLEFLKLRQKVNNYRKEILKIKDIEEILKPFDIKARTIWGWIWRRKLKSQTRKKFKHHKIKKEELNRFLTKIEEKFEKIEAKRESRKKYKKRLTINMNWRKGG